MSVINFQTYIPAKGPKTKPSDTLSPDFIDVLLSALPTPTNYSAANDLVTTHLAGVDTALGLRALDSAVIKKDGSVAFTGDQSLGGFKITNLANPVAGTDAANKDYVLSVSGGQEWLDSVLDKDITSPPGSPSTGDRYLIGLDESASVADGAWTGHDGDVATWNGSAWVFTEPTVGMFVAADDETDRIYLFGGTTWTYKQFEATTASGFLDKTGVDITLKNLANGNIIVGNGSGVATSVTPTGDVTISNAGVTAIGSNKITAAMLQSDSVTTVKILDANVTAAKLATDSVTTVKIVDANVTAAKLATDSVTTIKIVDANVTAAKLATDSVTTVKIVDANVTAAKLASDSVTTVKILDANVTTAKLAANSVTAAKLNSDVVDTTSTKLDGSNKIAIEPSKTFTNSEASAAFAAREIGYVQSDGSVKKATGQKTDFTEGTTFVLSEGAVLASASGKFVVREGSLVGGFTGLDMTLPVYLARTTSSFVQSLSAFVAGESAILLGYPTSATELKWSPKFVTEL